MRTAVNRALLGLIGLILLAVGLAVLVGGLDLQRRWGFTLPSWWPFHGPDDVLLSDHARNRFRHRGWWWPTVLAVLGLIVLIALWWLLAQLRNRTVRQVFVDSGDGRGAVIRGRALEEMLVAEAEALDGVEWAHAALTGRRAAPEARLVLGLAPHAMPEAILRDLDTIVLERARASAGLAQLPAEARLRAVRHRAQRVS